MEDEGTHPKVETEETVFPYVYGSLAFSMGKKGDSYTHKWICYVRGVNNEDLSYLIEKVVFTLHSSFTNPVRCTLIF
jgi:transcription initiation factor IIF auxiliary subunit